jgi:nitronate monooxygenase
MGTRFIATEESLAKPAYKQALVEAELDAVITTRAFTGLDSNMLRSSIVAAGLDPDRLDELVTPGDTRALFGAGAPGLRRWTDIWSAGHSVSGVRDVLPVADLVARLLAEYRDAADALGNERPLAQLR